MSEVFPLEIRALSIAFFYAISTAFGGITGPVIFGLLIGSGDPGTLYYGYLVGAALMIGAGVIEWWLGVDAEQESLESIATPVSAQDAGEDAARRPKRRRSSGRSQWAPRPAYSAIEGSPGVEAEIERLQAVLEEHGQLSRERLAGPDRRTPVGPRLHEPGARRGGGRRAGAARRPEPLRGGVGGRKGQLVGAGAVRPPRRAPTAGAPGRPPRPAPGRRGPSDAVVIRIAGGLSSRKRSPGATTQPSPRAPARRRLAPRGSRR